ncbi:SDR family oxidoreductase [Paenibacillus sp. P96]|uniref:SDR family oxidoreductase n=1 Tax=Paenibacillus zeirhizosphaerae TaxID=2987519 RepID=A0ABT9FPB0_9BACL|nr:SDR family oxidoreductase [Paenibacillus sp. P96]MDP4096252.1 SDR family oxidoreductase [Paenibacillus sp. P96]
MKILVTGATGQLGSMVVETLLTKVAADSLAVSVRDPHKADDLAARGVEVRQGDFDDPASLDTAFAGIDRLLLISATDDNDTRIRQHKNAVSAAQRAGVGFIAYTSATNAAESPLFLAEVHRTTEQAIRETGIPYSFLRNNWYLENEMGVIQAALAGAPVTVSAGSGKVGWALREDYAAAAAAVLVGNGHENTVYELSGTLATYDDLAAVLSKALGREVPVQHVDDEAYGRIMAEVGVPQEALPIVIGIQSGIRAGALEVSSNDLETLLGRPAVSLDEAVSRLVNQLK